MAVVKTGPDGDVDAMMCCDIVERRWRAEESVEDEEEEDEAEREGCWGERGGAMAT